MIFLILLCCLSWSALAVDGKNQPLTLYTRQVPAEFSFQLKDEDWRWLGLKKTLNVATWNPQNPPIDIILKPNIYEGISADYLSIVSAQLGLKINVYRYSNRDEAFNALAAGEVDTVMDDPGTPPRDEQLFTESDEYIENNPALVIKDIPSNSRVSTDKAFTLGVAQDYLTDKQIENYYPSAKIIRYSSNQSAISALVLDKVDAMLGNITTASFQIDRNYNNILSLKEVLPVTGSGATFVVRKQDDVLLHAINTVLKAVPPLQDDAIINSWFLGPDFSWLKKPIIFTEQEESWLKKHPVINVLASPYFAPIIMQGSNGEFHGISHDLLNLIGLRTGLKFQYIAANDTDEMLKKVQSDEADMISAISYSKERSEDVSYTRPFLFAPFVLVVRNNAGAPKDLIGKLKIATTRGNTLVDSLTRQHPDITWVYAANSTLAMRLVDEGKVDGAINNQVSADYMIQRYFSGKLRIASRVGESPAEISFALGRKDRELESILNKILADIQPRSYAKILNKWQGIPDTPLQTWRLYSTQYFIMFALALLLAASTLIWAWSLRRTMKVKQQAQAELLAQLNFRDTLLDGSPTPIYVVDSSGEVISRNKAWLAFFSHASQGDLNLSLNDRRQPLSVILPSLLSLFEHPEHPEGEVHLENINVYNGKETRLIAHWAVPLRENNDNVRGVICGWQDITSRERLLEELSTARIQAEQASKEKSRFLATMSHEIRTPISAIIGLLELAQNVRKLDNPDGEAIRLAYSSSQSLLELIGDVLDMAKIESGNLELTPEWVDPKRLINSALRIFDGLARQKGLTLLAEAEIAEELEVWIDPQRLKQILFNYLSNAIKFTHTGTVGISLKSSVKTNENIKLHISVYDSGIGMSEEDRRQLFVPFKQLEEGKKQTGSGLGLVISAELLRQMDGEFNIESHPGEGTTITLTFEVKYRSVETNNVGINEQLTLSENNTQHSEKISVLIVDDHPTNRLLLRRQLELMGHKVIEVEDGSMALEKWHKEPVDLIITDCEMPVMNGKELAAAIRLTEVPAVIWGLTANAQQDERNACLDAGMDECIFKPVSIEQLSMLINDYFSQLSGYEELNELLDLENIRKIMGGDERLIIDTLRNTCAENNKDLAMLKLALDKADWESVDKHSHRIAGAAEVLGANAIVMLCTELQHETNRDEAYERMLVLYRRLENQLLELQEAVELL
ncbi:transporter substrate-binding domain-containing protein [Pantoea sp. GbtcB22]|uniref:transporter substrate-binding domain-containing protein n=1 Tax=Pantoea sp. GbtcB22 TaxID=2824767 RepID=UPI0020C6620C|nr:transporter substrate-binding domain-containing protein [Pantoea sp. GbtcB22]